MENRLQSLDIFRGLTIAFMIIVNTAGNGDLAYGILHHAKWHGFTPTDLVFPSFVFITGVSAWFAFKKNDHTLTSDLFMKIAKRTAILFLLGVLLYAFPWVGVPLSNYRILGVLQRIALCYGIGSVACLLLNRNQIIGLSVALLLGYWGLMLGFGDLSLENNAVRHLDRFLFGDSHLYHGDGLAFDPEGLLSTLPSLVTFLIGYLVGQYIGTTDDKSLIIKNLSIAATALIIGGILWDLSFPINKKLWTSSYVLLVAGLSLAIFNTVYYIADVVKQRSWAKPFIVFGTNAILAYLISEYLIMILQGFVKFSDGTNGHEYTFGMFSYTFGASSFTSLLWSLSYVAVCWLLVYPFYRKKIFLKV
jgi:predicted acyltransferase